MTLLVLYQTTYTKSWSKDSLPEDRNVGISYCRLLQHNTMLKEKTGLSDNPVCECGNDKESAEHYLLHCTQIT